MLNAPYSHRTGGQCLNGTVMGTLAVTREAQCCSACSAAGPRCAGWTVRSAGGARTCELLELPLTSSATSTSCRSAVGNNKTAASGLQTLNSVALSLGAASSQREHSTIAAQIAHDAAVTNEMHLTTGLVGTRYLLPGRC